MTNCKTVALALSCLLLLPIVGSAEEKKKERPNVPPKIGEIRGEAIRGGYEDKLDKALDKYGGTRTKEVIEEDRKIRGGAYQGSGHPGDTVQPGLTGKEGTR